MWDGLQAIFWIVDGFLRAVMLAADTYVKYSATSIMVEGGANRALAKLTTIGTWTGWNT